MFRIDICNIKDKDEFLYVYGDKSILTELENNNILINHNCRQGHCGSCILVLLKGEVLHQKSLIQLSDNEILACMAIPVTDIKITKRKY